MWDGSRYDLDEKCQGMSGIIIDTLTGLQNVDALSPLRFNIALEYVVSALSAS